MRFVHFREARDLAAMVGGVDTCLRAIEEIQSRFDCFDSIEMKSAALTRLARTTKTIVFMRVKGNRLDPGDAYASEWIGGRGGGPEAKLGCTGKLVVGIHAHCGLDIDSLGLVLAP